MIIISTLSFILLIFLIVWACKVAKANDKSVGLWGVLTFFFGLIPLIILHFLVGKKGTAFGLIIFYVLIIIFSIVYVSHTAYQVASQMS